MVIAQFRGEYSFLSNFYRCEVRYKRRTFLTAEHAFQWAKTTDAGIAEMIRTANKPSEAKRLGRVAPLRPDWEETKVDVMREIVVCKFSQRALSVRLLGTEDHTLVEGNTWGDRFWGATWVDADQKRMTDRVWAVGITQYLVGGNHLGQILMDVRSQMREA
jgi:ribA/ribD-fused uncharacterized protein